MATKLESYVQMAGATAADVTKSIEKWTGFLATAAHLYRYSFPDQLLIHAQRPQAEACASFEIWNKRMRRYVRRGSRGIALVNMQNGRPGLRYVFDVKDTGKRKDARELYLWKYKEEYRECISSALEKFYGTACNDGIAVQLCHIAASLAKDFWKNYQQDIIAETEGSRLEDLDRRSLRVQFCRMAAFSITYILLLRCGFDPNRYFLPDVFQGISDFNTTRITKIIGHAVSEGSGDVLHQIAIAIFAFEREKKAAKHTDHQEQTDTKVNKKSENHNQPSSFIITVDNNQAPKPSVKDIYEQYKPIVKDFLLKDRTYLNACKNSDKENAFMEGLAAIKRAALSIKDLEFMKLFYDLMEFHSRMEQEVLAETYPELSRVQDGHQEKEELEPVTAKPDLEKNAAEEQEPVSTGPESPDTGTDLKDSLATDPEPDVKDTQPAPNPDAASLPQPAIIIDESEVEELPPARAASNYRIIDDHLGEGGPKDKYTYNMYAIIMLKQIESENRVAAPGEQEILAHYVGWGGIPDVFDSEKEGWEKEYQELQSYLTPKEYESARASVLNAHFTGPVIIKAMYEALSSMGFQSGNILEPSCGIGNFFGCLPEDMQKSKLYGVEIDNISGRIARHLYPKARIIVCGFESTDFPTNFFDLAIGNVPFGQYQVNDPKYNRLNFTIHNYFIAKSLELVRPGGILAFVTSRYTMDAQSTDVRSYLAEKADLLGAVRLPRNTFRANAGTDVVVDIIFLQKRDTPALETPAWVQTDENEDGFPVNSYFLSHPEMVLGTPASRSTPYGKMEYTVLPLPDADLAVQLHEAVSHIHGKYKPAVHEENKSNSKTDIIPADPLVKNYSFTVVKGNVYYRENSIMKKMELSTTAKSRVVGMTVLRDCVHQLISLQMDECVSDSEIKAKQAELNRLYDAYTRKYGLINDRANRLAFDKDSAYYLLCSLEILNDNGKLERKTDMFYKRTIKQHKSVTHVDTASEALVVSIGERARVDLNDM